MISNVFEIMITSNLCLSVITQHELNKYIGNIVTNFELTESCFAHAHALLVKEEN